MISVAIGGIGAVLFAILAGLMAGNIKNRQKEESESHLVTTLQKKLELAQKTEVRLRKDIADLENDVVQNQRVPAEDLKGETKSGSTPLLEITKRHNGKTVGRTIHTHDSKGHVETEFCYADGASHEDMLWHELDCLQKTAKDDHSRSRYCIARDCFTRSARDVAYWRPEINCNHGEKNDWVHWQTKNGTKSKRPSPILKTRMGESHKQEVLLTYVSGKNLKQFWCDASRCQKVQKPVIFASLSNDDIIRLCTKKQSSGKTNEEKADFREKLKGLCMPATSSETIAA